jgi:hypothetical protein
LVVVLLDFAKAFDSMVYDLWLQKQRVKRLDLHAHRVMIDNEFSDTAFVEIISSQGSVLLLILFVLN